MKLFLKLISETLKERSHSTFLSKIHLEGCIELGVLGDYEIWLKSSVIQLMI